MNAPSPSLNRAVLASLQNIRMNYGAGDVLKGVDATLESGKIISLLGLNGAGKSTLMHVLAGILKPTSGNYQVRGNVAMVSQELSLVADLSVAENLSLPKLSQFRTAGFLSWKKLTANAQKALKRVGLSCDPTLLVSQLSSSEAQLVEIARALDQDATLLILDEPTSALSKKETVRLFKILRDLAKEGTTILFVSHRLDEVLEISDTIWILKDGRIEAQVSPKDANAEKIVEWMTGIPTEQKEKATFKQNIFNTTTPVLSVRGLTVTNSEKERVCFVPGPFEIRPGSCVGIAGLLGSGRSVFLKALASYLPLAVNGVTIPLSDLKTSGSVEGAFIAYLHEDRKHYGLFKDLNVLENISMGSPASKTETQAFEIFKKTGIRSQGKEAAVAKRQAWAFSGGNQQKMLIGRALFSGAELLLLDEPTRGVDAHARQEIFKLMKNFTQGGGSILWVSSDLEELFEHSTEIFTMHHGILAAMPAQVNNATELSTLVLSATPTTGALQS